ncbi:MAG: peptide ABC transporter substrate-binding protein [Opitutae bacterium]|nr:peptide ABC transporter substrate-binding protein [Opitutae bacterium]
MPSPLRSLSGLLAAALLGACAKTETAVELGNRTQVLHQNISAEPQDLDPHLMQTNAHFNVLMALYEGLCGYDPRDLHPVPGVAERWDVSADGLTYTFHLRANAKWSNGDPVTAADFVFSAQRLLSPSLGSPYGFYYDIVAGAADFAAGRSKDFAQVGIRALDARTLRVELNQPAPYLPFLTGSFSWYPVHRATVEKHGPAAAPYTGWTKPGHIVTNGPFTLADWKPGQEIIVRKNPLYWDAARVRLQEIHFHLIENNETEERAFRTGQLHLTEFVPASKLRPYHDREPQLLQIAPFFMTYFYGFNTTRPPFNDGRVRRAFSLALDREKLALTQSFQNVRPATGQVPPGSDGYVYDGEYRLRFDPAEARRLLAAAGYPDGKNFPSTDLTFDTNGRHQLIAEVLQQMWQQNLGVHLNLANVEGKVFHAERLRKAYDLGRAGWVGDYLDPHAFLSVFLSTGGQNVTGFANADYDRLVRAALGERDHAKRLALYRAAEDLLLREQPILPLFFDTSRHLVSPAVKGRYPNLLDYHPYQGMWLEP